MYAKFLATLVLFFLVTTAVALPVAQPEPLALESRDQGGWGKGGPGYKKRDQGGWGKGGPGY